MPLIYVDTRTPAPNKITEIPHDTANGLTPPAASVTTWTLPAVITDPYATAIDSNGNVYVPDSW